MLQLKRFAPLERLLVDVAASLGFVRMEDGCP